tara:strand:- start:190 stop:447 length:258 start_codon:yes stop_codon:yes gene_type:complete
MVQELQVLMVEQVVLVEAVLVVVLQRVVVQEIHPHQVHHKDKQVEMEEMFQVVVVAEAVEELVRQELRVNPPMLVVPVVQEYQLQ